MGLFESKIIVYRDLNLNSISNNSVLISHCALLYLHFNFITVIFFYAGLPVLILIIILYIQDLATAGATKRPTCCVLVLTKPIKGELGKEELEKLEADYSQVVSDVNELSSSLF